MGVLNSLEYVQYLIAMDLTFTLKTDSIFKRACFKTPGVVNEQNGGRGNAHTLESSLCTTMVEIWQRRISKGKLREILGSIFGNCTFSPQLERQQASGEGATYKDLVGVVAR